MEKTIDKEPEKTTVELEKNKDFIEPSNDKTRM